MTLHCVHINRWPVTLPRWWRPEDLARLELEIYRTRPQYVLLWHHCRGRSTFFSNMLNCCFHILYSMDLLWVDNIQNQSVAICIAPIFRNWCYFQILDVFMLGLYCLSSWFSCARGKGDLRKASTEFRCSTKMETISNVFRLSEFRWKTRLGYWGPTPTILIPGMGRWVARQVAGTWL